MFSFYLLVQIEKTKYFKMNRSTKRFIRLKKMYALLAHAFSHVNFFREQ